MYGKVQIIHNIFFTFQVTVEFWWFNQALFQSYNKELSYIWCKSYSLKAKPYGVLLANKFHCSIVITYTLKYFKWPKIYENHVKNKILQSQDSCYFLKWNPTHFKLFFMTSIFQFKNLYLFKFLMKCFRQIWCNIFLNELNLIKNGIKLFWGCTKTGDQTPKMKKIYWFSSKKCLLLWVDLYLILQNKIIFWMIRLFCRRIK